MANINPLVVEFFDSFSHEIECKFNRLKHLVSHRGSSGNYHEEILRTVLKNFLTARYSVKTGFVYKDKDNVSNQIDILIVDESSPAAYVFQEGNFVVVIPEAVVAVIEVKTTLNAGDFDDAIDNVASVKRLFEYPGNITGLVFGYQGTEPSDKNLNNWFKREIPTKYQNDFVWGPEAILFFSVGCLLTKCEGEKISNGGRVYQKVFRNDLVKTVKTSDVGWQISILLALIVSACENNDFRISRRFKNGSAASRLIQAEGAMIGSSKYAFGVGKL